MRHIRYILRGLLIFLCVVLSLQAQKQAVSGDFTIQFKQSLKDSKDVLMQIKSFATSFGSFLQQADYFSAIKINAIKQEPKAHNKPIGFVIDFGYAGVGQLEQGFQGVIITPVVETVAVSYKIFFQAALELSCKQLFNGTFVQDPLTQKKVLRSSPFIEFFFKLVLLANGKARKTIDTNSFNAQLFMLINRLSQTSGFKSADDVVRSLPSIFKSLLNIVKIQGKSLQDFLKEYLLIFQEIKNYDFSRLDTTPLKKKDLSKFIKILCAIFLRGATDYAQAKAAFLNTPQGKAFYEKNKQLPEAKQTALLNQQLPAYQLIQNEMQDRVLSLIQRLSFYKKIRNSLKKKLSPLLDPLLSLFGMSLDILLPDDGEMVSTDEVSEGEADELLAQDPLFGEVQADVQAVALPEGALTGEEASAVEEQLLASQEQEEFLEGPHPIDLLDGAMDEFDRLDQLGSIEPSQEHALVERLMKAMLQALEEYETYELADLTDLAYALLDAESYVESQGDIKKLQDFFLLTKQALAMHGVSVQE